MQLIDDYMTTKYNILLSQLKIKKKENKQTQSAIGGSKMKSKK
jgi:hypothetical protein